MTLKEYLQVNSSSLLDNQMNIFILTWVEKSGLATAKEISKTTNLSFSQVNAILHILYKNSLISLDDEKYSISNEGVELLNKLGFSDLLIKNILENTSFKDEEYSLYNCLFSAYRKNLLPVYIYMLSLYSNKYRSIIKEYYSNVDEEKAPKGREAETLFWTVLIHELGHILYTNENSNLINLYTQLYDYSEKYYCFSSEVYHKERKNHENSDIYKALIISLTKSIRSDMSNSSQFYRDKLTRGQLLSQNLNDDFKLSKEVYSKHNNFVYMIFNTSDAKEFSSRVNISESQSRLILKAMREKINDLLKDDD